ncbi:MAG TPA: hypothetical protein VIO15_00315 [Bacteroidales bacterium]
MKTRILFSAIAAFVFTSGMMAQFFVQQNTNRDFSVSITNGVTDPVTYTWNASGAGITNSAAVNTTTSNTVNVTFGSAPSTGTLTVYGTANGCSGDSKTTTVNVVVTLPNSASFASASQNVCPQTSTNPTGGDAAVVVNFTGGNVSRFTYTIDGVAQPAVDMSGDPAARYSLDVATAFTNAQAGAHTIRITSITGTTGTSLISSGSEPTHTINVTAAPEISDIF